MVASIDNKDSSWRWVIVAGCFIANFCITGFQRTSASVFFVYFIEDFHVTREEAAWPTGLNVFFLGLSAMICGQLSHYLSIRSIMIVSGLICSGAVCLCSVANNMWQISLLYGVLQGAAMGPILTLAHVIIINYFANQRTTAIGISMAGTAVGAIIGSRVTHWLIKEYGLQGAFLLVGGIALNSLVGIVLLKDPESVKTTPSDVQPTNAKCISKENLPGKSIELEKMGTSFLKKSESEGIRNTGGTTHVKVTPTNVDYSSKENLDTNSIEPQENTKFLNLAGKDTNSSAKEKTKGEKERKPLQEMNWLRTLIHNTIQVVSDFNFCMITLSCLIVISTFRLYLMITVDMAEERFIPAEQGVFLLSVWSFGDLIGKLTIGWIVDRKWLKLKTMAQLLMTFNGVVVISVTFCNTYVSLMIVYTLLGFLFGSFIAQQTPITAEYLNRQYVPLALGINIFICGIVVFLLPVIVGVFKDRTQNYGLMFVYVGAMQIAAVIVWILASAIRKLMRNKGILPSDIKKSQDTVD